MDCPVGVGISFEASPKRPDHSRIRHFSLDAAPISFGMVQFRIAEALTALPILIPEAIWGLFVGVMPRQHPR